jgi:opacity protein-like surface antigen
MKSLFLCALLIVSMASVASADSIEIESTGAATVTVTGTGTTTYSNSDFNGWDIFLTFGSSNTPGLTPYGIDVTALVSCDLASCVASPLNILYSDTSFTVPVPAGQFENGYSSTVGGTGSGSTSEIAWANNSNTLFGLGATNKIGTGLGPFSGTNAGITVGGPASAAPYSLTIEDIFTDTSGFVSFSTDANVTETPEPSSLILFGLGLLMFPMALKQRQRA